MTVDPNRRPLASRGTRWAAAITRRLSATRITPNQISQASMVMALLSGVAFWLSGETEDAVSRAVLLIAAALFCQLRLLCNLFDGMVAVEAGKSAPDGGFWNEVPDRVADILILAGIGYGIDASALGWAAAALAVFTAYVREIGHALGAPVDFCGPMAKPHRMAVVTAAAAIAVFEPLWHGNDGVMTAALWIVVLGAAVTSLRRARRQLKVLKGRAGRAR